MNRHGQSIVEYALIAILVILGIVFMGPYVLRSTNAHFKIWDEGVKDSFEEHLKQAPVTDLPPIETTCKCSAGPASCGGPGLFCKGNEREWDYSCNLMGCNGATGSSYCVPDTTCCSNYFQQSCGQTPLGQTPPASDCNVGQRISASLCPDLPVKCAADSTCHPACQGIFDENTTAACTGQPPWNGGLLTGYQVGITIVASANACVHPCQRYCKEPYVPDSPTNPTTCLLRYNVAAYSCNSSSCTSPQTACFPPTSCGSYTNVMCLAGNACTGSTRWCRGCSFKNDASFKVCVDPHKTIRSVTLVPAGGTATGCDQLKSGQTSDSATPGQTCDMQFNY